jgi:hypothetical protein
VGPARRWVARSQPELADPDAHADDRAALSWPASATGLRLLAFQLRFLLAVPAWRRDRARRRPPPPEAGGAGGAAGDGPGEPGPPPCPDDPWAWFSEAAAASGISEAAAAGRGADSESPASGGVPVGEGLGGAQEDTLEMYDELFGRPTDEMLLQFQVARASAGEEGLGRLGEGRGVQRRTDGRRPRQRPMDTYRQCVSSR